MTRSRTIRFAAGSLLLAAAFAGTSPAAAIPMPEPGRTVVDVDSPAPDRPCFLTPHHWNDADVGPLPRCS